MAVLHPGTYCRTNTYLWLEHQDARLVHDLEKDVRECWPDAVAARIRGRMDNRLSRHRLTVLRLGQRTG